MINMYSIALKLAHRAHRGQTRRNSGIPYIVHPIRVANQFNSDQLKTIAILHDVVEDTKITLEDIEKKFDKKVAKVVDALSRRDEDEEDPTQKERYTTYIERVKECEIAVKIKIADVIDNLSDATSEEKPSMIERYKKTLDLLI